ncbi:MAG: ELM1/GtrOC1 family putative glycosyltransferase [Myxococcota bacterium]
MARVWVLTSGRTGDDKQSLRLATALGEAFEEKKIVFNDRAATWRLMLGPGLDTVDLGRSSSLEAPWPDMVISTGWRQVPVVRWVRWKSDGRTRLVQMNRPPGPRHFDLVLSPPQYEVPARANIVRLDWPLQPPPDVETLARASRDWAERLSPLPHPWTVLLLGGSSHPFQLGPDDARRLFEGALERARAAGGALLISTSRRTPPAALDVLTRASAEAGERVFLYTWRADATENPYLAFLADGDEFVVTPDSISMLVEVARLGRPLAIAPHTRIGSFEKDFRAGLKRLLHGAPESPRTGIGESLSDLASAMGLKFGRDLASVSRKMIERGWAADFPDFGGRAGEALPDDDFGRIVERARALLDAPRP